VALGPRAAGLDFDKIYNDIALSYLERGQPADVLTDLKRQVLAARGCRARSGRHLWRKRRRVERAMAAECKAADGRGKSAGKSDVSGFSMNLDRVSPHDLDAERAILGAILVNNDRLHDIGERVKPADFYRAAHQKLFEVMRGLSERGEAIDFVTVKSALGASLDEIGGPLYIAKLGDGLMSSSNIGEYCRIVKDKSIRRRLQAAADQAVADASNAELEASSALERAEVAIYEIAEREQRGDLLPASTWSRRPIRSSSDLRLRPACSGVSTGFTDLDS
jgi:hypothetical protein